MKKYTYTDMALIIFMVLLGFTSIYFFKNKNNHSQMTVEQEEFASYEASSKDKNISKLHLNTNKKEVQNPLKNKKQSPSSEYYDFIGKFQKKYPGQWKFNENSKGDIHRIQGTNSQLVIQNELDFKKWSKELMKLMGIKDSSISNIVIEQKTDLTKTLQVQQTYESLDVYNAWLSAMGKSNGTIFLINSQLKSIDSKVFTEERINTQEAKELALTSFAHQKFRLQKVRGPVIFADNKPFEKSMIFNISVNTPKVASYEVVVGLHTGEIRHKSTTSRH